MTSDDVGRGQSFAEPRAERLPLVQSHVPQVSVDGVPPSKNVK